MTETQLEWPTDLGYATIVGRFGFMDADGPDEDREPDITPATSGTVLITPSVDAVKYDGELGPMLLIKRRVEGVIDADGYLATKNADGTPGPRGIVVPATDADVQPTGFTYSVRISLASSGTVASYNIEAPTDAVVDLAKATPVASSGGTATVVDYTSAERAEAASIIAVQARDETLAARDQTLAHGITIDTSVGTRIYVGDVMIHGETGWRDIGANLLDGWAPAANRVLIMREGNDVTLRLDTTRTSDASTFSNILDLPTGFNPAGRARIAPVFITSSKQGWFDNISGPLRVRDLASSLSEEDRITTTIKWITADPWPSSLPGVPA